ncbi:hypothetical protein Tco_0879521, partial [Tanacetum coccineum]
VFSTWMTFGGNTHDLGSFGEETNEIADLHQILEEVLNTERGDGIAGIKRHCRDPSGDGVIDLVTASGRSRKQALVCITVDTSRETRMRRKDIIGFDLPVRASIAQGGFCLFTLKDFPLDVVEDALAQGADGLGATQDGDCILARTLQSMNRLTTLLFSHDFEMNIRCSSLAYSCERLLLKAKAEFSEQPTMHVNGPASGLNTPRRTNKGAGLDEPKHDLSTEESVAQKSASESSYFVPGANIKPNKSGSEEVADLDPDKLPTLAFIVLVSSIIPFSNLSHKNFGHTLVLNVSEFNQMTKSSVLLGALFVLLL